MTLPSRAKQVKAVLGFLENPRLEEMDADGVAGVIVDGYAKLMMDGAEEPAMMPFVGRTFRAPNDKVYHVAYMENDVTWCVSADSSVGLVIRGDSNIWKYCRESKALAGAPGNNPDWKPGDRISRSQRQSIFVIVATGDKCVMMRNVQTGAYEWESNGSLERYYKKEV